MKVGKTSNGIVVEILAGQEVVEFVSTIRDLNPVDQFDVFCMIQVLAIRAVRRGELSEQKWYELAIRELEKIIGIRNISDLKGQAGLVTSSDMMQKGLGLVDKILRVF